MKNIRTYLLTGTVDDNVNMHPKRFRQLAAKYDIRGDVLVRKIDGARVIGVEEAQQLLRELYNNIRGGRDVLFYDIKTRGVCITKRFIEQWLKEQDDHVQNIAVPKKKIGKPILSTKPNERWQIDFSSVLEYDTLTEDWKRRKKGASRGVQKERDKRAMIVVVDHFSKYAVAFLTPDQKKVRVLEALRAMERETGSPPQIIQCDNGPSIDEGIKLYVGNRRIEKIACTPYHSRSNGLVERTHRTLKTIINSLMATTSSSMEAMVREAVQIYNYRYHSSIKMAPVEALQRREEAAQNLKALHKRTLEKNGLDQELPLGTVVRYALDAVDKKRRGMVKDMGKSSLLGKRNWSTPCEVVYARDLNYGLREIASGQIVKFTAENKAHAFNRSELLVIRT